MRLRGLLVMWLPWKLKLLFFSLLKIKCPFGVYKNGLSVSRTPFYLRRMDISVLLMHVINTLMAKCETLK